MGSAMEIGLFQLESLFSAATNNFVFIDLRRERAPVHPNVDPLLAKASVLTADTVQKYLTGQKTSPDKPIVLVCEDGKTSEAVARDLEAAGFEQIYVVTDGVKGLLSET